MNSTDYDATRRQSREGSRRTDGVSLVAAVILLAIAVIGIGRQTWWLIPNLLPWAAAGIAALIGLGLIVSSLPGRRRGR
jgi:NhaP-type Na+/H+ or K+/H+ antiporter